MYTKITTQDENKDNSSSHNIRNMTLPDQIEAPDFQLPPKTIFLMAT